MTDLAWMKTYIGTETAFTGHLTAEEFGAYERLRRHCWQHGGLPDDGARLTRISGIEPERWASIASAIVPLLAEALPRLDSERLEAATKREKKVAAGRKGAEARWFLDGKPIANANGKPMADAMRMPMENQWPSASALDEERYEEGLAPTRARARERDAIPQVSTLAAAEAWLRKNGIDFPPDLTRLAGKMIRAELTRDDIERCEA
jgi:uncharacterized protein YdaU (DUF1376 family)